MSADIIHRIYGYVFGLWMSCAYLGGTQSQEEKRLETRSIKKRLKSLHSKTTYGSLYVCRTGMIYIHKTTRKKVR